MTLTELRVPALLLTALVVVAAARATVTETVKEHYPFNPKGTIHLENVNGNVDIVAWDKNEVSLEAEKRGKSDEDLKRVSLEIDAREDSLSIKTKFEKKGSWWGKGPDASVRYKLMVPAGVALKKIEAVNSDISVRGVTGSASLDTVNGRIEATGLAGGGKFETVNGSIDVEFATLKSGDKISLDSVNGSCRIVVPKNSGFQLDADNVNGRVTCDFPITLDKSGRHHLRGMIGGGGANISLDSVNGSLRVEGR
jgi:DUF4097 and DUF4098 domain-containing protein YvlB